jgi:hypothetical protein
MPCLYINVPGRTVFIGCLYFDSDPLLRDVRVRLLCTLCRKPDCLPLLHIIMSQRVLPFRLLHGHHNACLSHMLHWHVCSQQRKSHSMLGLYILMPGGTVSVWIMHINNHSCLHYMFARLVCGKWWKSNCVCCLHIDVPCGPIFVR